MGSDNRTGETPNDQSSKKVRIEDVVVPTPSPGADDVVVDHSLDLTLSPPRNNTNLHLQETAAPAPIVPTPSPPNNMNLYRQETVTLPPIVPPPSPRNNFNFLYRLHADAPAPIVPPPSPRNDINFLYRLDTDAPAPTVRPPSPRYNINDLYRLETDAPAPIVRPPSPIQMMSQYTGSYGPYFGLVPPPRPSSPLPVMSQVSRPPRQRKNTAHHPKKQGKSATVEPPFPWAENKRAMVRSVDYLLLNQIDTIKGEVQCKRCEKRYEVSYNLVEKFNEVWKFVVENRGSMNDRAPAVWMNPTLPTCKYCNHENSARPVVAEKKREINWVFLVLGQMLGCCTLDQLKYFCKHTKNHRTGAKDRVLYLTYLELCKQLNPNGPFNNPFAALA